MLACLVLVIVLGTMRYKDIFPAQLDRVQAAVQGKCQVVLRNEHPALGTSAEDQCTASMCMDMAWDKKEWGQAPVDEWHEKAWDGDRGLKVVSSEPYLAGAVDCPCVDPGVVAGKGGAKAHEDAPALILMISEPLQNFPWTTVSGDAPCVHVHWFRGAESGTTEAGITDHIIAPRSLEASISISKWIEVGEMDCFKIAASGDWRYDELFVNANKDGYIEMIEKWDDLRKRYIGFVACFLVVFFIGGISCCVLAKKCKSKAESQ